jgi:hypothetical protein
MNLKVFTVIVLVSVMIGAFTISNFAALRLVLFPLNIEKE